jgi:hypothetical protein
MITHSVQLFPQTRAQLAEKFLDVRNSMALIAVGSKHVQSRNKAVQSKLPDAYTERRHEYFLTV